MHVKKRLAIALVGALFVGVLSLSAPVRASAVDSTATALARMDQRLSLLSGQVSALTGLASGLATGLSDLDSFTRSFYQVEKSRYDYYVKLHQETKQAANSAINAGNNAAAKAQSLSDAQAARYQDFVNRYNQVVSKLNSASQDQSKFAELELGRYEDLMERQKIMSRQIADVSSAVATSTNRVIEKLNSLDVSGANGGVSEAQMESLRRIQSGLVSSATDCYENGKGGDAPWWSLSAPVVPSSSRPCSRIDDMGRGIGELLKEIAAQKRAYDEQKKLMEQAWREAEAAQNDEALERAEAAERRAKESAEKAQKTREQIVREIKGLGEGIASGFKKVGEGLNGIADKLRSDGAGSGGSGGSGSSGGSAPDVKGYGSGIGKRVNDWGSIPKCLAVKPGSACKAFPIRLFGGTYHVVNLCSFNLDSVHRWRDVVGAVMLVMVAWAGFRWLIASLGVNVPSEGR